ncbi:MAG: ClC family H(+)/Cl(-) exchange transporter [Peptoniphilus sp.]|uniref:ClC family H(+)/Cl(-) exchange transporter n=1 Tax=Peptoniphilus sp. TaxID=1971214 RepID=UPI0025E04DE3|nr:ClC family H(+)/Cl(-) exchange transporter [Peptoniphilus sp.]MCI5643317.1 ClC family H(+)/Cl(-) exchange transporter [Peptoniphilus sp.]MDD7352900.1 ClC family H(+)/Cl(-) exchange transporter [Peptoniphilaceae bacterium]MDY3903208.1 ClC family H(+)/Cl(-) exchange transporter [Peptoniphilus sp.]
MKDDFNNKGKLIFRILFDSLIVGTFAGLFSVLYRFVIMKMDFFRKNLYSEFNLKSILVLIILAIIISFVIYILLKWAPLSGGSGIPQIRGEILGKFKMDEVPTLISKIVGGGLGNLMGFSLGREGPSIQMGGAAAKIIGKAIKRPPDEIKYMITAGAAAGLAAAFNAPMAGCIFAIEELHKSYSKFVLLPSLVASIVANYVSFVIMGAETSFSFFVTKSLPMKLIWVAILIGILTGIVGGVYNYLITKFQDLFKKINSKFLKYALLMGVTIIIGFMFFEGTGGGHGLLEKMAKGQFPAKYILAILLVKLFYTTFCYGSGVQGGIFLPVLVIGGSCGALIFSILQNNFGIEEYYVNFIILGMSGILASVVRSPILSVILVSEMTSTFEHLIALSIVVMVSYYVAEILKVAPIYDTLFERQLRDKNLLSPKERELGDYSIFEYTITDGLKFIGKTLRDINFPKHIIIMSIEREGVEIVPTADDIILYGDKVTVLVKAEDALEIDDFFKNE